MKLEIEQLNLHFGTNLDIYKQIWVTYFTAAIHSPKSLFNIKPTASARQEKNPYDKNKQKKNPIV